MDHYHIFPLRTTSNTAKITLLFYLIRADIASRQNILHDNSLKHTLIKHSSMSIVNLLLKLFNEPGEFLIGR